MKKLIDKTKIKDTDFAQTLKENMAIYAIEVNENRAIPSVIDGLKPVQRRILYMMMTSGASKKDLGCAEIVGSVLGNLHPHGDSSVYEALVRLSQPLIMAYPLIDFHGNNGSLTDPAAAYRYTKAKLSDFGTALLQDYKTNGVIKWKPNFNETQQEPEYLLGTLGALNLLVNPSIGIGVGLASHFTCHNIQDIFAAVDYRIKHPKCNIDELLQNVPLYPSFKSGGVLINKDTVQQIYRNGKGLVVLRGEHKWEGNVLTLYGFPYRTNATTIRSKIIALQEKGQFLEVEELYEDAGELRLYVKRGVDHDVFMNMIYKKTSFESKYAINMMATDLNGKPRLWTLLEILDIYIKGQHERIIAKAQEVKEAAERDYFIQTGIKVALDVIDQVVAIVRGAEDETTMMGELKELLQLEQTQINEVLKINLRQLTRMNIESVIAHIERLKTEIAEQTLIVELPEKRIEILEQQTATIKIDEQKRTECVNLVVIDDKGEVPVKKVFVYSNKGDNTYTSDYLPIKSPDCRSVDLEEDLYLITSESRGFKVKGKSLRMGNALPWKETIKLNTGEKILRICNESELSDGVLQFEKADFSREHVPAQMVQIRASIRGKQILGKRLEIIDVFMPGGATNGILD